MRPALMKIWITFLVPLLLSCTLFVGTSTGTSLHKRLVDYAEDVGKEAIVNKMTEGDSKEGGGGKGGENTEGGEGQGHGEGGEDGESNEGGEGKGEGEGEGENGENEGEGEGKGEGGGHKKHNINIKFGGSSQGADKGKKGNKN